MNKWLLTLAVLTLGASNAHAHATLKTSTPANGGTLASAPKEVTLTFSEPVRLTMLAVQQIGKDKRDLGPLPTKPDKAFTLAAPALANGQYIVEWRALADDGHVMTGQISFGIGVAAAPVTQHSDHDHEEHHDHADKP